MSIFSGPYPLEWLFCALIGKMIRVGTVLPLYDHGKCLERERVETCNNKDARQLPDLLDDVN